MAVCFNSWLFLGDNGNASPTNGSNEEDNDDDDNWTVDTSEDAIKARQVEGLSQGIKGKHIFLCTGIPRLVRFFEPQKTALIGD